MAEHDYVRLGCAVEDCNGQRKSKGYCERHYRQHPRGGIKTDSTCQHCGTVMVGMMKNAMYCGRKCKVQAWRQANPDRAKEHDAPRLCAYIAKYCDCCGKAHGSRRDWSACPDCLPVIEAEAKRIAYEALAEAAHKATAKVVACSECAIQFCPLRGYGMTRFCPECRRLRDRAHKDKRDDRIRARARESVVRRRVFQRCGWLCMLCGIHTPESLQGANQHNAPELDHIHPVSRGGEHTYANTQLLCRSCNGWKGARTMDEVLAALVR